MENRSQIPQTTHLLVNDAPEANASGAPSLKSDAFEYDAYDLQLIAAWSWEGNPNGNEPDEPGYGGQKS